MLFPQNLKIFHPLQISQPLRLSLEDTRYQSSTSPRIDKIVLPDLALLLPKQLRDDLSSVIQIPPTYLSIVKEPYPFELIFCIPSIIHLFIDNNEEPIHLNLTSFNAEMAEKQNLYKSNKNWYCNIFESDVLSQRIKFDLVDSMQTYGKVGIERMRFGIFSSIINLCEREVNGNN